MSLQPLAGSSTARTAMIRPRAAGWRCLPLGSTLSEPDLDVEGKGERLTAEIRWGSIDAPPGPPTTEARHLRLRRQGHEPAAEACVLASSVHATGAERHPPPPEGGEGGRGGGREPDPHERRASCRVSRATAAAAAAAPCPEEPARPPPRE
jgi:hypothetical protein